jgi:hypothetical protein
MGVDQRRTGQGGGLDGNPHDHDMVGKGHHGHGGQKQQHGPGEDVFRVDVGCLEIGDGIYGNQEKEQGNHQQGEQSFRCHRKIVGKQGRQMASPYEHGEDQVNGAGEDQQTSPDFIGKKECDGAGKKGYQKNDFKHEMTTYSFKVRKRAVSTSSKVCLIFCRMTAMIMTPASTSSRMPNSTIWRARVEKVVPTR